MLSCAGELVPVGAGNAPKLVETFVHIHPQPPPPMTSHTAATQAVPVDVAPTDLFSMRNLVSRVRTCA